MRFADWSVVGTGGCLIALSLIGRWVEHAKDKKRPERDRQTRFYWAWLPLLLGSGEIMSTLPGLLGAPYSVREAFDTVNLLLAVITVIAVIRIGRRVRATRTAAGAPPAGR